MGRPEKNGPYEHRFGLPPVIGDAPKVLILGTILSKKSAESDHYYGNPQNYFWRLMAEVLGKDMPDDYFGRCKVLTSNGIALWDVLAECDIKGSKDHTIINPVPNDLATFLKENDSIHHVFINGKKAFKFYNRFNDGTFTGKVTMLPSSSPANAISWLDRCKGWMGIKEAL